MNKERKLYAALQGLVWSGFVIGSTYGTYFMQQKGISVTTIGTVTAAASLFAAILQTVFGQMIDAGKFTWKFHLTAAAILNAIVLACMMFPLGTLGYGIMLAVYLISLNTMVPVMNTACFYYAYKGIYIEFGSARAFGSLTFAFVSLLIGRLTGLFQENVVPVGGIVLMMLILMVVWMLPYYGPFEKKTGSSDEKVSSAHESFIHKYPFFVVLLIGFVLVLTLHNVISVFLLLIIQDVGGGSQEVGIASFISAMIELVVMFGYVWLRKRFKAEQLLLFSAVVYCIRGILYLLAGSILSIYLIQLTQAVTYALYGSASVYYANDVMDDSDKSRGQGLVVAALTIAGVIGSLLGGFLCDHYGVRTMLVVFICIAAVGVVLICAALRMQRRSKASA